MSELLLCPFCGGNAKLTTWTPTAASISCIMCGAHFNTYTEAEAIAAWNSRADYHGYEQAAIEAWESIKAWNSRAERTCEFNIKDNMNETEGMGDVWIECSACNCVFDFYADEWLMKMSYCPNCGARRVGE